MARITTTMITLEKISRRFIKPSAFACLPQNKSGHKNIYCITRYAMLHEKNTNEEGQGKENGEIVELRRSIQTVNEAANTGFSSVK